MSSYKSERVCSVVKIVYGVFFALDAGQPRFWASQNGLNQLVYNFTGWSFVLASSVRMYTFASLSGHNVPIVVCYDTPHKGGLSGTLHKLQFNS